MGANLSKQTLAQFLRGARGIDQNKKAEFGNRIVSAFEKDDAEMKAILDDMLKADRAGGGQGYQTKLNPSTTGK